MTRSGLSRWFPPLRDSLGDPYPARVLMCVRTPPMRDSSGQSFVMWDEDAPAALREQAQWLCRRCPALTACHARAQQIIDQGRRLRGVWSGQPDPKAGWGATREVSEHDPIVVAWAAAAGITLPDVSVEAAP